MEAIKAYRVKALNRRIEIVIYQNKNNHTSIRVFTKRLLDFKKREIVSTDIVYSLETFLIIKELFVNIARDEDLKEAINILFPEPLNIQGNIIIFNQDND